MFNDEVANRAANSIITGPEDLSEQEKYSFHDFLQEWCNARPISGTTAQVISDKMRESFFEKGKGFKTCWRDEGGLTVSSEFVRFKDGVTKAKAIETAIVNLDKCERAPVDRYNSELIIALARMRIVRFAKEGTGNPRHIPLNQRTLKCQLISDDFEEHYTITREIHDRLKARKIGRAYDVTI
ncbi:hypothetical protein FNYG_03503 [Fusarium nygamai]|uniref:Uncharacterized protein n=1 Tax=Gibberella nygamai TaxID=42673 RepID=A0A2K0WLN0_GIBNY|nr:hypothetical protein FNYG_03503 [Fusarium nygamai]